jgi:hypothetical protein
MDAKRIGIRSLGWLSIIVGYGLGLLLIRGVYIGTTRGFRASPSQAFWVVLGYLLFLGLAVYLFSLGRRGLSIAKGNPRPRTLFGWGRIVLGAILLYSSVVSHFHLIPGRDVIKPLEPTNETQAVTMKVTAIFIPLGCLILILSGIWKGFRAHRANARV